MKYTMGFRMPLTEEIRGSDDVEHNIIDDMVIAEKNHSLGRKVSRKDKSPNVELGEMNDIDEPVKKFNGAINGTIPE